LSSQFWFHPPPLLRRKITRNASMRLPVPCDLALTTRQDSLRERVLTGCARNSTLPSISTCTKTATGEPSRRMSAESWAACEFHECAIEGVVSPVVKKRVITQYDRLYKSNVNSRWIDIRLEEFLISIPYCARSLSRNWPIHESPHHLIEFWRSGEFVNCEVLSGRSSECKQEDRDASITWSRHDDIDNWLVS
jgi:hypothetical protein